ncbi:longitudinals lacking protein, isoforms H/M/V-like isoform X8 [Portunus trituberculatus]|uniref:longitudinals lacking protein, isoforms H/M/V-like isoform X8 n=1 Tax=Portunus trituberculatus TaxID=210409 RepID=UPI001E1CB565|nr:longitudinals lacking protein, isoforms H/M/V-like isoform X8 [Portunus trituberculatus]
MEDGLLSLKWNNHKTTFFDILRVLREKANYTDATIAVEGKFYPVHKLVMSTCSEYFSEIFERTPCKSPVIVLKDVRSQDMDALLDYMYLGEVNVNQNDLASLLKTAECLRIKGLAVPDEDPTKTKKQLLPDDRRESPPPKRRRHEDPTSTSQTLRPTSPPASSPSKNSSTSGTAGDRAAAQRTSSLPGTQSQDSSHDSIDPPPMVKVEMEEAEDLEDGYRRDNSYEGGSINEGDGGDYGSEVSKSEHDPENYGGGSYAGPSLQQGGDLPWEEGDSSSFPPEGFSGDHPGGQQPQGGPPGMVYGQLLELLEGTDGCSEDIFKQSSANTMSQVLPINSSGMGGLMQPSSLPLELDCSMLAPPAVQQGSQGSRPPIRFFCPMCPKGFRSKLDMERHLRTHTGEKPFKCPYCTHRSATKGNLKAHMRHIHMDIILPF